jgi:hypothetical protein
MQARVKIIKTKTKKKHDQDTVRSIGDWLQVATEAMRPSRTNEPVSCAEILVTVDGCLSSRGLLVIDKTGEKHYLIVISL